MNLTTIQKKVLLVSSIVGGLSVIAGAAYKTYSWLDATVVSRPYLDDKIAELKKTQRIATVELNLRMIDESLARYHSIGVDKLNDVDRHRYDKLILAEQENDKQRKHLLGL